MKTVSIIFISYQKEYWAKVFRQVWFTRAEDDIVIGKSGLWNQRLSPPSESHPRSKGAAGLSSTAPFLSLSFLGGKNERVVIILQSSKVLY